jgi:hypothetical protein
MIRDLGRDALRVLEAGSPFQGLSILEIGYPSGEAD